MEEERIKEVLVLSSRVDGMSGEDLEKRLMLQAVYMARGMTGVEGVLAERITKDLLAMPLLAQLAMLRRLEALGQECIDLHGEIARLEGKLEEAVGG
jgi:hypothetical protein